MMDADERRQFEALRQQVACDKQFACIGAALSDLCQGVYHRDLDILECLEKGASPCKFAKPFGEALVCTCPLRKFIARNFEKWSDEDTSALRQPAC
jgi:hypothetical protein